MSNLFKKVTSTVSVVAVAVSAVGTTLTAHAASEFLPYADALATNGVVAKQDVEAGYRLSSNVTRSEMAKIAVNMKGLKAAECSGKIFSDVTTKLGDLCGYVEAAAAAGIVSKNAKFRPMDLVTRAEMIKMLLGAKGIQPTDVSAGFKDVDSKLGDLVGFINAAVKEGIISKKDYFNPSNNASRGEAFKVAANAAGLTVSTGGDDDLDLGDIFGDDTTATGTTSTGTASTGTTVVVTPVGVGSVGVALNPASPANGTQVPMSGIVRFAVVDFTAGSNDVALASIELKKAGLSTVSTSTKVWFEKNGLRLSGKASFTSEGNAIVSFAPSYVVKAGSTESLELYVELGDTTSGTDYQFVSGNVTSTAATVSGSFSTPVLRTANYAVATFTLESASSSSDYKASNDLVELGAFKLSATKPSGVTETRDVKFQSITMYQSGSANLSNLSNIQLVRDGVVVATGAKVDGKALTFSNLGNVVKDGTSAIFYVKANINNVELSKDYYQFYLKNTSDVNIVEVVSSFRASTTDASKFVAALYSVNGGDVRFDRDAATSLSLNAAPGTQVVLMQGTINAKNAVTLEDPELTATVSSGTLANYFSTLYLVVGGSVFSATATGTTTKFTGTTTVSGTGTVKLYGTLKSDAQIPTGQTIKFSDLTLNSFKGTNQYVSNQNTLTSAVGSVPGVTVNVDSTVLSVTRNDGLGNTTLAAGSKGVTLYGVQFSSTKGNPVSVSSASIEVTTDSSGSYAGNAYLTLYVNGTAVTSKTVDTANQVVKFDGFNTVVSASGTTSAVVKADFSDAFTGGAFQVKLNALGATDTVTSKEVAPSHKPVGALFTVASASASLALSDNNPQANLFLAGVATNKLFAFKATASNDNIKLKNVILTGANLGAFSNFRLTDAAGTVIASSTVEDNTNVKFESVNTTNTVVAQDKSVSFFVVADANTNTNKTGAVIALNKVTIVASNGAESDITAGATVKSNLHAVAQNSAVVAKATNSSKELTTSALRFTVTASGKNFVTLANVKLSSVLSGYTGSTVVKIYKDSVSDANLAGSGTLGPDQTIALSANSGAKKTVDAGTTATYIVAVEGATGDASVSGNKDWTITLKDVALDTNNDATVDFQAAEFYNVGQFPITEVK